MAVTKKRAPALCSEPFLLVQLITECGPAIGLSRFGLKGQSGHKPASQRACRQDCRPHIGNLITVCEICGLTPEALP